MSAGAGEGTVLVQALIDVDSLVPQVLMEELKTLNDRRKALMEGTPFFEDEDDHYLKATIHHMVGTILFFDETYEANISSLLNGGPVEVPA